MNNWPIFICYRQTDGKTAAARVFDLLKNQTVPLPPEDVAGDALPLLDVYFDQAAPGVEDWTAVHEPYLNRARAFIVICTPGSKLNEGEDDWVHREIGWWLDNREMAPILVDPLGADMRYVPDSVAAKWPNAQRIRLMEMEWEGLSGDDRHSLDDRVRARFLGAIIPGGENFYRQELEQEKERFAKLLRSRRVAISSAAALLAVLVVAGWTYYLKDIADRAATEAQAARSEALVAQSLAEAAHRLAQARVVQSQAARAITETRLIGALQRFDEFDSYEQEMGEWEEDFQKQAAELSRRARDELRPCEGLTGGTVYEGQLVGVDGAGLPEHEALFIYLSVVPGQSARPGDWAPAVLDVFVVDGQDINPGRDLTRPEVMRRMASVKPENRWGLLMGLGAPHVLTHLGRNYGLAMSGLRMNDDGDMIMGIELCLEAETVFNSGDAD